MRTGLSVATLDERVGGLATVALAGFDLGGCAVGQ